MSKTLRNAVLTALGILLALALLVFGGNRLVYQRSLNATVFEWELRRNGRDSMTQGEEHWLKVRTDVNRRPIRLPEDLESAVVLRDIHGLSYEEIGQVLDINVGTVRSRLFRGRSKLREILSGFSELL